MEEVFDIELPSHLTVIFREERPLDKVMLAFLNMHGEHLQLLINKSLSAKAKSGPVLVACYLKKSIATVDIVDIKMNGNWLLLFKAQF